MLQVQSPFQQFFGLSGDPLDDGSIYIGIAGQNPETNPISIFWDEAGTLPAAQPLKTLNGYLVRNGTPARVYTSQEDYSLTVRDRRRHVVFSVLDATALSNLRADLLSPSGSSIVTYLPDGVGATQRTVQSKLRETVSVLDFGADSTGASSSVLAIRAAIVAAREKANSIAATGVNAKSVVVLFPPGKYLIDATVLCPPNIIFRGDGATILCWDGGASFESGYYLAGVLTSNWSLSDTDTNYYGLSGLRFENLTFFGGDTALKLRSALWQAGVFDCSFYDCHIAIDSKQCYYSSYKNITIRGENAGFASAEAIRFMRQSNRISIDNVSISSRLRGMVIGEAGDANASANISMTNCSFEVLTYGVHLVGTFFTFTVKDIYIEAVDSVFFDIDGALKYGVDIQSCYSYSTSYFTDLSGLRDSFIGSVRDNSPLASVKAVVQLRQGTYGNQAVVELSDLGGANTGSNRYRLSNGVVTKGALSKYTSGSYAVLLSQDVAKFHATSQYADQAPIHASGWYGEAENYVIGAISGIVDHTPLGTSVAVSTAFYWSQYTMLNYSIMITPNVGSGAGGTTPAPIYLRGTVIGADGTQIGTPGHNVISSLNVTTGGINLAWSGFGTSNTDPDYAWMRNGLFLSEGIIKLS